MEEISVQMVVEPAGKSIEYTNFSRVRERIHPVDDLLKFTDSAYIIGQEKECYFEEVKDGVYILKPFAGEYKNNRKPKDLSMKAMPLLQAEC